MTLQVLPWAAPAAPAVGGVDAAAAGAAVAVPVSESVDGVDAAAAAAAALKRRTQKDKKNTRDRERRARVAAEKAAAPVLPAQAPVPSAGEGVDAAVKAAAPVLPAQAPVPSDGEVGPSPSKKQKAAVIAAKKLVHCIAGYAGRGRATPAAPPRMRTLYLGRELMPTKIVMRPGGGGKPAQRYGRSRVVRRGPLPAHSQGAPAPAEAAPAQSAPAPAAAEPAEKVSTSATKGGGVHTKWIED
jgi:hypothetical protein